MSESRPAVAPGGRDDRFHPGDEGFHRMWYLILSFVAAGIVAMNLAVESPLPPSFNAGMRPLAFTQSVFALAVPVIVSTLALLLLHRRFPTVRPMLDSLVISALLVTGFIWILTVLLAPTFFTFGEPADVLGIYFWGYDAFAGAWRRVIPLEAFLLTAVWTSLLLISYVVFSLFLLRAYTHWDRDQARRIKAEGTWLAFHPRRLRAYLGVLLAIFLVRRYWNPYGLPDGLPVYPWLVATLLCLHWLFLPLWVRWRINWRAVILTCYLALLTGIIWEAGLGYDFGWWRYRTELNLGVTVVSWNRLPLSAVFLWLMGSMPLVSVFETVRVWRVPPDSPEAAEALAEATAFSRKHEPAAARGAHAADLAAADREPSRYDPLPEEPPQSVHAHGALITWASILVYTLAAAIALRTTFLEHGPPSLAPTAGVTAEHAYTWSLVLFVLPTLAMVVWVHRAVRTGEIPPAAVRAFWLAAGILAAMGFALDTLFGLLFFNFRNRSAVLGSCARDKPLSEASLACLPSYNWGQGRWAAGIPVEEFLFYALGSVFVLVSYLWLDRHFVNHYRIEDPEVDVILQSAAPLLRINWRLLSVLVGMAIVAFAAKNASFTEDSDVIVPGYALFLVFGPGAVVALLYRSMRRLINWPAAFITCIEVVMLGMVWEASLGVPYDWWNYQSPEMVGIFVPVWHHLPLEAVILWVLIAFPTIFVFEAIRALQRHPEPWPVVLFGQARLDHPEESPS